MNKKKRAQEKEKRNAASKFVGGAVALIGLISAALALFPRVIVDSASPVDVQNPFSGSFTIINTGYIPLTDTNVSVGISRIVSEQNKFELNPDLVPNYNIGRIIQPQWQHHNLALDEKFTITLDDLFRMQHGVLLSGADILIFVSYKPWVLPFRQEKAFRFITKRLSNGSLQWYSLPFH